jgi:hypothetical protein
MSAGLKNRADGASPLCGVLEKTVVNAVESLNRVRGFSDIRGSAPTITGTGEVAADCILALDGGLKGRDVPGGQSFDRVRDRRLQNVKFAAHGEVRGSVCSHL